MRVLGTLALTIAMGLAVGASAQEACDWQALWDGHTDGGWLDWISDDYSDDEIDLDITIIEIEEGGSWALDIGPFGDFIKINTGACEDNVYGDGFWIMWDHDDGFAGDVPDDLDDPGDGLEGTNAFGLFVSLGEALEVFAVQAPQGPCLTLGVEGNTFDEEGGDIILTACEDMNAPYQWKKDGTNIGGATNATFSLLGAVIADSGTYLLSSDDGEAKALFDSNPVSISIFAEGSLPVAGLIGLGLLAAVGALGGVVALRKKK